MRAVWLEDHRVSLRDVPLPVPPPGEALVRLRLAGICATDLELVKGYYPYRGVLGHEFVGEVVASAGRPELVGQRVVGEINAVCGVCETCLRGDATHCENRTVLGIVNRNGAFAEYLVLPDQNLHRVPEAVPDDAAVFTEPLAAALEILEQVEVGPGMRLLLVGAGRLGQLIARVLAKTGADLSVLARHARQRELLTRCDIRSIHGEEVHSRRYDLVVEATGSPAGFDIARAAVRPRGTIVLKSTYKGDLTLNVSSLVVDEITLLGSRCGPFAAALGWLSDGIVVPTDLIDARYPLADGLAGLEHAARPGAMKILLVNG